MALKRFDPKAVEKIKKEISYYENLIEGINTIKRGGRDAFKIALKIIEDMELDARVDKDSKLLNGDPLSINQSLVGVGKQMAYQDVLTLFKKPSAMLEIYEKELSGRQAYLKDAESRVHRPSTQ